MKNAQSTTKSAQKSALQNPLLQFIIALVAVFAIYGRTINYNYLLDDDLVFTNASVKQGVSAIPQIFSEGYLDGFNGQSSTYRPLVLASFAIEQSLHGNNARMNHMVHLLLYALLCFVLWQLLQLWFQGVKPLLLLAAILIFLLHPIHTEVICNLKSRDELLAGLFVVLSLLSLSPFVASGKVLNLVLATFYALLGMLSKETAVMLLPLIPLVLVMVYQQELKRLIITTAWFLVPLLLFIFLRQMAVNGTENLAPQFVINNAFIHASFLDRIATSAYLFWLYVFKSFAPINLTWDYSFSTLSVVSLASAKGLFSVAALLGLAVFGFVKFKTEKISVLAIVGFTLFLIPTLNLFVLIGANFAERFLFIPSIFWLVLLVSLSRKWQNLDKLTLPIFSGISVLFLLQTAARIPAWERNETLFEASLLTNPESARVQNAMGTIYRQKAESMPPSAQQESLYKQAILHFDEAVKILPEAFEAIYNKGVIFQSTGRPDLAEPLFEQVIAIDSNYVDALNNLGVLEYNQNRLEEAEQYFNRAYKIQPSHPRVVANVGLMAYRKGDYETARIYFVKSLELNPDQENVRKNLEVLDAKK